MEGLCTLTLSSAQHMDVWILFEGGGVVFVWKDCGVFCCLFSRTCLYQGTIRMLQTFLKKSFLLEGILVFKKLKENV